MNYPHKLRRQLTTYGLVISLLLQGCGKATNSLVCSGKRRVDPARSTDKHALNKRARVASRDSGQEKLKKRNKKQKERDKYRVAHRKRKRSKKGKQIESQKAQRCCGLDSPGIPKKQVRIKSKTDVKQQMWLWKGTSL